MEETTETTEETMEAKEESTAATTDLAVALTRGTSIRLVAVTASQARSVADMACPART